MLNNWRQMAKKTRNSTKTPERSTSERIEYHKGINRTLRKRIDNLENRMHDLETRMNKYKELLPEPECINFGTPKKVDEREEFLKKYHPNHRNEEDE